MTKTIGNFIFIWGLDEISYVRTNACKFNHGLIFKRQGKPHACSCRIEFSPEDFALLCLCFTLVLTDYRDPLKKIYKLV